MADAAHAAHVPHEDDTAAQQQRARQIADERRRNRPLAPRAYYTRRITQSLVGAAIAIPFYYLVLRGWVWPVNPRPPFGEMWMVPGLICLAFLILNLYWAARAAEADSDDLGMSKDWYAQAAVLSCVITLVIMLVLSVVGYFVERNLYQINMFQVLTMVHFIVTLLAVQWLTSWVRRMINRRYFGATQVGVDG